MGSFSIWHWIIVLVVVVLVFGTSKLKNVGRDLGGAFKDFKKSMKEDETTDKEALSNNTGDAGNMNGAKVVDNVEVKKEG